MATKTANSGRNVAAELAYLTRTLKAPSLAAAVDRLAERARAESWTHEEFLAACLQREVAARESHGGEGRIRAARFPARKALEDFDFDHQRSLKRDTIAHLGTLDFVTAKENVVFLGPPGTGKTHCKTSGGCSRGVRTAETCLVGLAPKLSHWPLVPSSWICRSARRSASAHDTPRAVDPLERCPQRHRWQGRSRPVQLTRKSQWPATMGCLCFGFVAALAGADPAH